MDRYSKIANYIADGKTAEAESLFRSIMLETARGLYESMGSDELENTGDIGGDASDDLIGDVETDEMGTSMEESDDSNATYSARDVYNMALDCLDDGDELDEIKGWISNMVDAGALPIEGAEKVISKLMSQAQLDENVSLQPAPKPVTQEPDFVNRKSINATNSGSIGAMAKPVVAGEATSQGRKAPKVGELIGKVQNSVTSNAAKLEPAVQPKNKQSDSSNTTTPFPKQS